MFFSREMARKMLNSLCVFATLLALAQSDGEFSVLHSPDSIKFSEHKRLPESLLKEVYSAALGLSVEQASDWTGLSVTDPFSPPEAVVEVYIDGISSLGNAQVKAYRYPLAIDEYTPDAFSALAHRVTQRYTSPNLINLELDDDTKYYSSLFGNVKITKVSKKGLEHLRPNSIEEDFNYLQELEVLNSVAESVEQGAVSPDNVADVFFFRLKSLHSLIDLYGPDSPQAKEAVKMLGPVLERLTKAFEDAYSGSVLVTVVASDVAHTRRVTRSLQQAEENPTEDAKDDLNLATEYSGDYPVIFNLILWFNIVFWFSLIAIAYVIMDMDPGRDSIIYRMTSNRIKKDN